MPLHLGNWKININGTETSLSITSVDNAGRVRGSLPLFGSDRIIGLWDETSQELTFAPVPLTEGGDLSIIPVLYKGYLFSTPASPQPGQDVSYTLAGFFQVIALDPSLVGMAAANSRRNIFGWFAQITVIT